MDDLSMRYFHGRLKDHMASLTPPLKYHDLQFLAGIQSGIFSSWNKPKGDKYYRLPSDTELEKIAGVEQLGLSIETLKGWRAIDEYGAEAVLEAAKELDPARFKKHEEAIMAKAREKLSKE